MQNLIETLKRKIVETLDLADVDPAAIDADAPLVSEGLGLDSIDVLELAVMIEQDYGIKINTEDEGKALFASVRAMAEGILARMTTGESA
jgi:acyl carrier protein